VQPNKRPVCGQFQFRAGGRRDDDFDFVHRSSLFQTLGEGRPQLFRRLDNSVGYLSYEVDRLDVIKEDSRIRTVLV